MKKLLNVVAFIIIAGLVGSWECGNSTFAELLCNTGNVLTLLLIFHLARMALVLLRHNISKKNVINS